MVITNCYRVPVIFFLTKQLGNFYLLLKKFGQYSLIQLNFANFYGTFRPNFLHITRLSFFSPPPPQYGHLKSARPCMTHGQWGICDTCRTLMGGLWCRKVRQKAKYVCAPHPGMCLLFCPQPRLPLLFLTFFSPFYNHLFLSLLSFSKK